uniref:U2A'/phosphoprotein 32 family A C-terminal domain-containing protein n=1 Tax=Anopheles atroparvus TaxID=41427 RepID=A0A182J9X9_ANOAO
MEKRILLEKRGRSDDQITELILDNCRSTYIDGLTESFTALETLSLINVGLVSLKNFPKLSNLRKLELSDNRISNGLSNLTGSPKLTHLNLSGNRIKDFEELQPLKDLQNLEVLDLFNNQVTLIDNYRDKIFQLIPSLTYLDGFDKDFAEAPSDEEEIADDRNAHPRHPSQFSINGIEIDLDELEQFESRVRQKRSQEAAAAALLADGATASLGAGLGQLDLAGDEPMGLASGTRPLSVGGGSDDDLDQLYVEIQRKQAVEKTHLEEQQAKRMVSFLSLLLTFASLLALINHLFYRGAQQLQNNPGVLISEEEDSCEESDDVSLAYLYNDDLEEDQEDWKSVESDYNNVDDEFDTEDEEGGGEDDGEGGEEDGEDAAESDGDDGEDEDASESETRGKKRKFEGTDSDG